VARGDDMRGACWCAASTRRVRRGHRAGRAAAQSGLLASLQPGAWRIVLGGELARLLGVRIGDKVTLVAPSGQVTPAGTVPRLKQFTLAGVFDSGHYEYDSGLALIHMDDAARLYRLDGPTGVQLRWRPAPGPRRGRSWQRHRWAVPAGARLDAHQPQLVRRGADRESA
jgi:lipoprotein-releasing system permease protein